MSSPRKGYDLYDNKEELLTSVQALKHRINSTDRTLSLLNSSRSFSPKRTPSPHKDFHALTLDELGSPCRGRQLPRQSSSYHKPEQVGVDETDGAGTVTLAAGDAGSLRAKLNQIRLDNNQLVLINNSLQAKLKSAESKLRHNISVDMGGKQEQIICRLQDRITSLEAEVQSHDKALVDTEALYAASQRELTESRQKLHQCNILLTQTETRMQEQMAAIQQLRQEKQSLLVKVNNLETVLAQQENETQADAESLRLDVGDLENEKLNLTKVNDELNKKVLQLTEHLSLKEELLQAKHKEYVAVQKNNDSLNKCNRDSNERIKELKQEVASCRNLQHQNTELNAHVSTLTNDMLKKDEILATTERQYQQEKKKTKSLLEQIQAKTVEVTAIDEQFGVMESALKQQKQRIETLEEELQQMDQIKMENIELKCRGEEVDARLAACQKEMFDTHQQLSGLEEVAVRLQKDSQSSADVTASDQQVTELRKTIKEREQDIEELQASFNEMDSKLKLSQLHLDFKENKQKKSSKQGTDSDKLRLRGEITRMKNLLSEKEVRCGVLNDRLKELESELTECRRKLQNSQQSCASFKQKSKTHENDVKSLSSKVNELEKVAQNHKTEMENMQMLVERLQRKLKSVNQELASKSGQLDEWTESSRQQTHFMDQQRTMLEEQKEELKRDLSKAQKELAQERIKTAELTSDLQRTEKILDEYKTDLSQKKSEYEKLQSESESQIQTLTLRIRQLEADVRATKDNSEMTSSQAEETKSHYEKLLLAKQKEYKEANSKLAESQNAMQEAQEKCMKKEQELADYKLTAEVNSAKMAELTSQQTSLQKQISLMEEAIEKDRKTYRKESKQLEEQLSESCHSLKQARERGEELIKKMSDLEKDKAALKAEVNKLQNEFDTASRNDAQNADNMKDMKEKLAISEANLIRKTEEFQELESHLQRMEVELQRQTAINNQFENEFRRAQCDLQGTMGQLEELQAVLSVTKDEKQRVELRLKDVESSLKRSREELLNKTCEIEELDGQIRIQERQLLERSHQVSQLDLTLSQHKNDIESQLKKASEQLKACQINRDDKAAQISTLCDEVSHLTSELNNKQLELQAAQMLVRKLQQDLQEKSGHVNELEERLDALEDKSRELMNGLSSRGVELQSKIDLIMRYEERVKELQRNLSEIQRERQSLIEYKTAARQEITNNLDKICGLEQKLILLEEKLVAGENSPNFNEAILELESLQVQHRKEIARLEAAQKDMLDSKHELDCHYNDRVSEVESRERQLQHKLGLAQEQINSLKGELQTRLDLLRTANEAVVIKEAEVARLRAKVSGIERTQQRDLLEPATISPAMPSPIAKNTVSTARLLTNSPRGDNTFCPVKIFDSPLRMRAVRSLFSPGRVKTSQKHRPSASFIDCLDLASESTGGDHSILLLHGRDSSIAKEKEELLARLDLLDCEATSSTSSQMNEELSKLSSPLSNSESLKSNHVSENGEHSQNSMELHENSSKPA